jgi:hypothetical protein
MEVLNLVEIVGWIVFVPSLVLFLWVIVAVFRWKERRRIAVGYLFSWLGAMVQAWGFAHISSYGWIFAIVGPMGYIIAFYIIRSAKRERSAAA